MHALFRDRAKRVRAGETRCMLLPPVLGIGVGYAGQSDLFRDRPPSDRRDLLRAHPQTVNVAVARRENHSRLVRFERQRNRWIRVNRACIRSLGRFPVGRELGPADFVQERVPVGMKMHRDPPYVVIGFVGVDDLFADRHLEIEHLPLLDGNGGLDDGDVLLGLPIGALKVISKVRHGILSPFLSCCGRREVGSEEARCLSRRPRCGLCSNDRTHLRFRPIAPLHLLLTEFHRGGWGIQVNGRWIRAMASEPTVCENRDMNFHHETGTITRAGRLGSAMSRQDACGKRNASRGAPTYADENPERCEGRLYGVYLRSVRQRFQLERIPLGRLRRG